jgi:UDP-GlcNAc:undecaprenyl-phosphate GlcNAc-1-phosphate transferase
VELAIAVTAALVVPGPVLVRVATAVLVLGLLNAVNLLDGQDGLAAGVGIVITVGLAALGGPATPIALGVAGALGGFLVFNRPPARIYLGDAGAYFLGTTIALLPALTEHADTTWSIWWTVPLLVGLPVADTAIAILRRLRAGRPLLEGDRSHVYDQLVDRGMTVGRSTLVGMGVQVVLTGVGLAASQTPPLVALGTTLAVAGAMAAVAVRAGLLDDTRV